MQQKYKFDKDTWIKIGRGVLIASGGSIITYLLQEIPNWDFGKWTPIAVSVSSIVLNTVWQWIKGKDVQNNS